MSRFYFWHPILFRGQKTKFYNGANGHILLCNANSQNPAKGDRGIIGIYIAQLVLTNTRVVLGIIPNFIQGGMSILVNIFDHVWNWRLTCCLLCVCVCVYVCVCGQTGLVSLGRQPV